MSENQTSEEKSYEFSVLSLYKDAKKKGKLLVRNKKELISKIFELFGVKELPEFSVEYSKNGKWCEIPEDLNEIPKKVKILLKEKQTETTEKPKKKVNIEKWKDYVNKKFGISVKIPENFVHKIFDFPGQPLTSVTFLNPDSPLSHIILTLEDHPIEMDVEEYYNRSLMSLQLMGTNIQIGKPQKTTVCSFPAIINTYTVTNFQNQKAIVWQGLVTFQNRRSFAVQTISEKETDENLEISEILFKSLKIFKTDLVGTLRFFCFDEKFCVDVPSNKYVVKTKPSEKEKKNLIVKLYKQNNGKTVHSMKVHKYTQEPQKLIDYLKNNKKEEYEYDEEDLIFSFKKKDQFMSQKVKFIGELGSTFIITSLAKTKEKACNKVLFDSFEYWNGDDRKLFVDYMLYNNPEFSFEIVFPNGIELREHADVDPVVTICTPKFGQNKNIANHYEIAVSCRGLPKEMDTPELHKVLKIEYEQNPLIDLKSIDKKKDCITSHFKQTVENNCLDYYVSCFLATPNKCLTVRTTCFEKCENKESVVAMFKMIHKYFRYDSEKIKDNEKYTSIL